ncbi:protein gamma response 1 [Humulus lupulus]|uniref:protein gamma response 1 n=1 Tax=Humulus lupulus TaxID=3486 RepID=UPI002B407CD3|nr:protein gamma response 1 [Humulus lupulus]XP_062094645.1 protein gamma response 1 [Humulus lupulus]
MEGHFQNSQKWGSPTDSDEVKYVSGLSTLLVATIQEAKDRISQIEDIFCSHLFPTFQSKSEFLQKIYSKARMAAYTEWKEKENELRLELRQKNEEVAKGIELRENLLKKIETKDKEIMNYEKRFHDHEKEKQVLVAKLEGLEENFCEFQKELGPQIEEIEEKRLQNPFCQETKLNGSEMLKLLDESEKEKKLLLETINGLQGKVNELQVQLRGRTSEMTEVTDLYNKSLEQIQTKSSELLSEKTKRRDVIDAYKRLKSQFNFLCSKFGVTRDSLPSQHKLQDVIDSLRSNQDQITSPILEDKNQDTSGTACDIKVKNEITVNNNLEDVKMDTPLQSVSCPSPMRTFPISPKCPSAVKSAPLIGRKRPASCWRETRSHQGQKGPDPHDDFLDTPLESIRGNLNKSTREEELCNPPVPSTKDKIVDGSDDETQDMTADLIPQNQNQIPLPNAGEKCFKFVEPVRKKAERENLKGVECKQCKKFYDAVLCSDKGNNTNNNFRCEHHDGVSRHRYRYVPPMTPEGFWNIGFESEM